MQTQTNNATRRPHVRQGIMLCTKFTEARLTSWGFPVIVQPKLNGRRCRAVFNVQGHVDLFSSEGNPIVSVPHILEQLKSTHEWNLELDGELYCHGIMAQDIHSIVSPTVSLHPDHEKINFVMFDVVNLSLPQVMRVEMLEKLAERVFRSNLKCIKSYWCNNHNDLDNAIGTIIPQGYEGVIIRHPYKTYERKKSLWIMKYKPRESLTATITGTLEEVSIDGKLKGTLGALVCDYKGVDFRVGSGFTHSQREALWKLRDGLPGKKVVVKFQELTKRGAPLHPVFTGLV